MTSHHSNQTTRIFEHPVCSGSSWLDEKPRKGNFIGSMVFIFFTDAMKAVSHIIGVTSTSLPKPGKSPWEQQADSLVSYFSRPSEK